MKRVPGALAAGILLLLATPAFAALDIFEANLPRHEAASVDQVVGGTLAPGRIPEFNAKQSAAAQTVRARPLTSDITTAAHWQGVDAPVLDCDAGCRETNDAAQMERNWRATLQVKGNTAINLATSTTARPAKKPDAPMQKRPPPATR